MSTDAATPHATPYLQLGGETAVRALVDHFYDLMDLEPGYAALRSLHPDSLDGSRDKLHWFSAAGWAGLICTASAWATRACVPATCPMPSACLSVTSGWPA